LSFFYILLTTPILSLSLYDALPISRVGCGSVLETRHALSQSRGLRNSGSGNTRQPPAQLDRRAGKPRRGSGTGSRIQVRDEPARSEEHTSELQSHLNLVCRLLLEKK